MLASSDRILITHVGSLPRNATLSDLLIRQEAGDAIDAAELGRHVESATAATASCNRRATTCECSTKLVVVSSTPGISSMDAGKRMSARRLILVDGHSHG